MGFDATARRRWFGIVVLLAAMAMLLAGETVLKDRLGLFSLLLYWLGCLALTLLAIGVALRDARVMRQQTRQEERDLVETTLKEIEFDAKSRPLDPDQPRSSGGR